jgi:hypothetical protein
MMKQPLTFTMRVPHGKLSPTPRAISPESHHRARLPNPPPIKIHRAFSMIQLLQKAWFAVQELSALMLVRRFLLELNRAKANPITRQNGAVKTGIGQGQTAEPPGRASVICKMIEWLRASHKSRVNSVQWVIRLIRMRRGAHQSHPQTGLQISWWTAECPTMPLLKLNRINKGGEILINTEHILVVEMESRTTTIHMTHNLLFSVEETPDVISDKLEMIHVARIKDAIQQGGLSLKPIN